MKKIHVSAINRKVRDDEKLFVEECDRKYNEKLVVVLPAPDGPAKSNIGFSF